MKGRIKCILSSAFSRPLLFALLLISSLVLSSLTPLVANAASDYDSAYQQTETLTVGSNSYAGLCSDEDMTNSWGSVLLASSEGASFSQALNTGAWAVRQWEQISPYQPVKQIDVFWVESGTMQIDFTDSIGTIKDTRLSGGTVHRARISNDWAGWVGSPDCEIGVWQAGSTATDWTFTSSATHAQYGYELRGFLATNTTVNYPTGYEGEEIPDSAPGAKTIIKPDFTYSVNNKDVQAKDYNQTLPTITPDEGYTIQGYSVEWSLFKCGSYTVVGNICNDPDLVKHQILPQGDNFNYSVSDYGDYHLQAQYLVQECYRYPSYPATPDYCFYVDFGAEAELDDYDFTSTTVYLKIDGSAFSGDTKEGECDVSGFCEPPSPYEDCSTYGLDVVGGLGCVIRNFGVWLTNTLKMLFIPTGQFFKELFDDFNSFFNEKLGFIAYPITFLIGFFTDVMNAAGSPNCAIEGGSLFGVNADIDLCKMQNNIPQIYNGIIVLIRAAVAFTLIFALFRKYHEVVGEGGKA